MYGGIHTLRNLIISIKLRSGGLATIIYNKMAQKMNLKFMHFYGSPTAREKNNTGIKFMRFSAYCSFENIYLFFFW